MNKILNLDVLLFLDEEVKNNSVELIIADPPYNILPEEWDTFKNEKEYFNFMYNWIKKSFDKLIDGGTIYIFNNSYNSAKLIPILEEIGYVFRDWIVWYKKDGFNWTKNKFVNNQETILFFTKGSNYFFNSEAVRIPYSSIDRIKHASQKGILKNGKRWFPNPNGKLCTNVWEFTSDRHINKVRGKIVKNIHPTPKPEALIERMILASSKENDLVLDLFSGTGTTTIISIKNKRNSLGCELNEKFYNFSLEKIRTIMVGGE